MTKINYNYKYIAVSHSLNLVWGLGNTEEEALRDAMSWMHDAEPDADEYTDWDLFRESRDYEDLDLIGITEDALNQARDEPNGFLDIWLENNKGLVEILEIGSISTDEECRAYYYAGRD